MAMGDKSPKQKQKQKQQHQSAKVHERERKDAARTPPRTEGKQAQPGPQEQRSERR